MTDYRMSHLWVFAFLRASMSDMAIYRQPPAIRNVGGVALVYMHPQPNPKEQANAIGMNISTKTGESMINSPFEMSR